MSHLPPGSPEDDPTAEDRSPAAEPGPRSETPAPEGSDQPTSPGSALDAEHPADEEVALSSSGTPEPSSDEPTALSSSGTPEPEPADDEVSVDVTPGSVTETVPADAGRRKRSWKSRLLELALWAAVAILTAVVLVYASDRWLPSNF